MTWQQGVVVALVGVPVAGSIACAVLPSRRATAAGIASAAVTFAAALIVLFGWVTGPHAIGWFVTTGSQPLPRPSPWHFDAVWLPGIDVHFRLGVDGISLPLVELTALLSLLCAIHAAVAPPAPHRPRALQSLLALLETGMLGTFLAGDLILFFVFFEVVLVPMYFLIGVWGGSERRRHAATKFILYTLLGSVLLLAGFVALYAERHTFDMDAVSAAGGGIPRSVQDAIFAAFFIGFGIKTPMWPLHTWLPDAHTEAPTVGSVLLAGVLLKMGTYGFLRIAIPMLPRAAHDFAPWLGAFGVVGICYAALVCLGQRDLKRLIAYSSVGHMGFVLLGLAALTPTGANAALFASVAHGVVTGLLFFLVGALKDRYHTDSIRAIGGGVLAKLPSVGGLLVLASIASLGLPGLAGFWGEMLSLLAAYHPAPGLSRPLFLAYLGIAGLGAVLTAGYLLFMLLRVTFGVVPKQWHRPAFPAIHPVELAAWTPLVVLTVSLGLYPRLILGISDQTIRYLYGMHP